MQVLKRHGAFAALLFGVTLLGLWLWVLGGAGDVTRWAANQQQEVQSALAGALRAARGGEPWAAFSLLSLCFAYGFFHAAGPGHGKLVMGGYALGEDVPRSRVIGLTLAGSLGQAVTAIIIVVVGAGLMGWSRSQMTDLADGTLAIASAGAIVLVGLWLMWRGLRRVRRAQAAQTHTHAHAHHEHEHHHDHDHSDGVCDTCGHAHGPSAEQIASAHDWRTGLAVVLAVAARPCTGALFVLILTFAMGIPLLGMLGALVMGLGTAILTLLVALGAWHVRDGLAERMSGASALRAMGVVEMLAGLVVAVLAAQVASRLL